MNQLTSEKVSSLWCVVGVQERERVLFSSFVLYVLQNLLQRA